MPDQSSQQNEEPGAQTELRVESGGKGVLTLRGRLDARSTVVVWRDLEQRLPTSSLSVLEVDATGIEACDGAGFALLHFLRMGGMTPGAPVTIRGLRGEFRKVF